jgi:hypothetical protein
MDGATWGDIAQTAITTALPLILAYIFSRSGRVKDYAESLKIREERVDELWEQLEEARAERDAARSTAARLRAELARVRGGEGAGPHSSGASKSGKAE